jgi:integrase
MLGTGMRIGEAAGVRDQVLDLTARTVRVDATSCARRSRLADPAAHQDTPGVPSRYPDT